MWIFDRSRTTYAQSVEKFMTALSIEKADKVFEEVARLFGVTLEAAKNTYATPIFHLGVGYKVNLEKYSFGKVDLGPEELGLTRTEYRYTETALILASRKISVETFLLINIIRFQVLNTTLERSKFDARLNNTVLPLLLTIQVLRALQDYRLEEAYITTLEIGWLYERINHCNINEIVEKLLDYRANNTVPPPSNNADAFFNLFRDTGIVIKREKVTVNGSRKTIMVLAANRSMVVDKILENPPQFFPICWEDRWKWAKYYSTLPDNIERFLPPKNPFFYKVSLPDHAQYDQTSSNLILHAVIASALKKNDLVVWDSNAKELYSNAIYRVEDEPVFTIDGKAFVKISIAYRSLDPNVHLTQYL